MALLQIAEPGQSAVPHQHKRAVGIDLGTTNSLVAAVRSGQADKALATAARGILQTLESAGLTLAVTDAGALQVSPASALRPDQRVAIRDHRAGLVALLRLRGSLFIDDERHRCSDCVHLQRKGYCAMAQKGLMPSAARLCCYRTGPAFCR